MIFSFTIVLSVFLAHEIGVTEVNLKRIIYEHTYSHFKLYIFNTY